MVKSVILSIKRRYKIKNLLIYYSVGALLYCPANKESITKSIINEKFGDFYSIAFCLEDTISDAFVEDAK